MPKFENGTTQFELLVLFCRMTK